MKEILTLTLISLEAFEELWENRNVEKKNLLMNEWILIMLDSTFDQESALLLIFIIVNVL